MSVNQNESLSSRAVRRTAGVTTKQLNRWSQAGLVHKPVAVRRGRLWTPDTADRAWRIKRHLLTVSRSFGSVAYELFLHGYIPTNPELVRSVLWQAVDNFEKALMGDRRTRSVDPVTERRNMTRYITRHYGPVLSALQPLTPHLMDTAYAHSGVSKSGSGDPSFADMRSAVQNASASDLLESCELGNLFLLQMHKYIEQLLGSLISSPERLFGDDHITDHTHTLVESLRPMMALAALVESTRPSTTPDTTFLQAIAAIPRTDGTVFSLEGR